MVGALLCDQLLPDGGGAGGPVPAAGKSGVQRATRHAALSAQSAFPVQYVEQHLHAGAAEADGPGQCHALAPVLLPALYPHQRADRAGDDRAGDRDAETLSGDREDAVRGRSEEHTYELQSLMSISYTVFCL